MSSGASLEFSIQWTILIFMSLIRTRFYNPATGVVGIRRSMCMNDKSGRMSIKNENIGLEGV